MTASQTTTPPGRRLVRAAAPVAALAASVAVVALWASSRTMFLATTVMTYAVVGVGLAFIYRNTGMLSMAHAGLWGTGAYASALVAEHTGLNFLVAVLVAAGASMAVGAIAGLPSLRASGHYLLIVSFMITLLFVTVARNLKGITDGASGKVVLGDTRVLGLGGESLRGRLVLYAVILVVCIAMYQLIERTRPGRLLPTVRESEPLALSLGVSTKSMKLLAFSLSGIGAGIGGALYAYHVRHIVPETFGLSAAILFPLIVLIGGSGNPWGPLVGAFVVVFLPEVIGASPNIAYGINGLLLMLIIIFAPQGIIGVAGQLRRQGTSRAAHEPHRDPQSEPSWPDPARPSEVVADGGTHA